MFYQEKRITFETSRNGVSWWLYIGRGPHRAMFSAPFSACQIR